MMKSEQNIIKKWQILQKRSFYRRCRFPEEKKTIFKSLRYAVRHSMPIIHRQLLWKRVPKLITSWVINHSIQTVNQHQIFCKPNKKKKFNTIGKKKVFGNLMPLGSRLNTCLSMLFGLWNFHTIFSWKGTVLSMLLKLLHEL